MQIRTLGSQNRTGESRYCTERPSMRPDAGENAHRPPSSLRLMILRPLSLRMTTALRSASTRETSPSATALRTVCRAVLFRNPHLAARAAHDGANRGLRESHPSGGPLVAVTGRVEGQDALFARRQFVTLGVTVSLAERAVPDMTHLADALKDRHFVLRKPGGVSSEASRRSIPSDRAARTPRN